MPVPFGCNDYTFTGWEFTHGCGRRFTHPFVAADGVTPCPAMPYAPCTQPNNNKNSEGKLCAECVFGAPPQASTSYALLPGSGCNPATHAPFFLIPNPNCSDPNLTCGTDLQNLLCPCANCFCFCARDTLCHACCPVPPCVPKGYIYWDRGLCDWVYLNFNFLVCPDPATHLNPATCNCDPCPAGQYWCNQSNRCTDGPDPPCKTQLNCKWSIGACKWQCDDPATVCAPGRVWNQKHCRCEPPCPPLYCWCNATGLCIGCPSPTCSEALHCVWDSDTCTYACDDPSTKCPGSSFDTTKCKCVNAAGPSIIHDRHQRLWVVESGRSGLHVRRSYNRDPPYISLGEAWEVDNENATTHPEDTDPAIMVDSIDEKAWITFSRGANTYYITSDSGGNSWEDPLVMIPNTSMGRCIQCPLTQVKFIVGFRAASGPTPNQLIGKVAFPGDDPAAMPEFVLQTDPGTSLPTDNATFDLSAADDNQVSWEMAVVQSNVTNYFRSTNFGKNWEQIA